jgi:hypothetical protein
MPLRVGERVINTSMVSSDYAILITGINCAFFMRSSVMKSVLPRSCDRGRDYRGY